MPIYDVRRTCEYGAGVDDWEYKYEEGQTTLNPNITCPTHPSATLRDFVVLRVTPDE